LGRVYFLSHRYRITITGCLLSTFHGYLPFLTIWAGELTNPLLPLLGALVRLPDLMPFAKDPFAMLFAFPHGFGLTAPFGSQSLREEVGAMVSSFHLWRLSLLLVSHRVLHFLPPDFLVTSPFSLVDAKS